jgi:hypothetical protein
VDIKEDMLTGELLQRLERQRGSFVLDLRRVLSSTVVDCRLGYFSDTGH